MRKFTIIYKTYRADLEWFKYSVLALKKYLDFSNIHEVIVYTHSDVLSEVTELNVINFRIIPVDYDYHGYIKQMVVKCNCYKDCNTDYIIILDSDLVLTEPYKFNVGSKIIWKYLKNNGSAVFKVWKKAFEDSTLEKQTIYYMENHFPFIFTKQSLIDADLKFKELHNIDYDGYCKNRLIGIGVSEKILDIFPRLAEVFEEFEYLGWYCHNFSDDYIFIEESSSNGSFKQYWSHGGITKNIKNELESNLF